MSRFDMMAGAEGDLQQRHRLTEDDNAYRVPAIWAEGPVKSPYRKMTDKLCLILFLLILATTIAISIYALVKGDERDVRRVYDSSGNACGIGRAANYPYLYFQTFTAPLVTVCVKECPKIDYSVINPSVTGLGVSTNTTAAAPNTTVIKVSTQIYNVSDAGIRPIRNATTTLNVKDLAEYDPKWSSGVFTKQQWTQYLANYKLECLLNNQVHSCKHNPPNFYVYDSFPVLNSICLPANVYNDQFAEKYAILLMKNNVVDLYEARPIFWTVAFVTVGMSIAFLLLLAFVPGVVTWVLLITVGLGFLGLGIFTALGAAAVDNAEDRIVDRHSVESEFNLNTLLKLSKTVLIIISVFSFIFSLITFYFIISYRKYIKIAMSFIQLSAQFAFTKFSLMIIALVTALIQVLLIIWATKTVMKLSATGIRVHPESYRQSPFVTYERTAWQDFLIILFIFGVYWLFIVLNNLNDFVTAAATADHYWKHENSVFTLLFLGVSKHLGSIAWSIILLPLYLVKLAFGWIDWLIRSDKPNFVQKTARVVLCPCCWIYEKLVSSVSEDYLAITYFGSEDFGQANRRVRHLNENYRDVSDTISTIGHFVTICGKLLIAFAAGAIGYSMLRNSAYYRTHIYNGDLVIAMCVIIGLIISTIFLDLFNMAYQTMLICYLIEYDLGRGRETGIMYSPPQLNKVITEIHTEKVTIYEAI